MAEFSYDSSEIYSTFTKGSCCITYENVVYTYSVQCQSDLKNKIMTIMNESWRRWNSADLDQDSQKVLAENFLDRWFEKFIHSPLDSSQAWFFYFERFRNVRQNQWCGNIQRSGSLKDRVKNFDTSLNENFSFPKRRG